MSKTVDALTVQIGKAQTYLDRAGRRDESDSGESGLSALPK
jgi:hypothetical protein